MSSPETSSTSLRPTACVSGKPNVGSGGIRFRRKLGTCHCASQRIVGLHGAISAPPALSATWTEAGAVRVANACLRVARHPPEGLGREWQISKTPTNQPSESRSPGVRRGDLLRANFAIDIREIYRGGAICLLRSAAKQFRRRPGVVGRLLRRPVSGGALPCWMAIYWQRSATIGSTRSACHAGIAAENRAIATVKTAAPA
jgi:hypothetical protein